MNANKLVANILKYIEARRNLLIALLKLIMLDAYKQLLSTILAFYVNTGLFVRAIQYFDKVNHVLNIHL